MQQECPPAGNRKRRTARGITCPSAIHFHGEGGWGYPHPALDVGVPPSSPDGGGDTPSSPNGGGVPLSSLGLYPPLGHGWGYPQKNGVTPHIGTWMGVPLSWTGTWLGYSPTPSWDLDGVPLPPPPKTWSGYSPVDRYTDRRVSNYYLTSYFVRGW